MKSLKKTTMKALLSMALLFGFIPVWASQPKKYSESEYSAAVEDFRASIAQLEEESEVAAAEKASLQVSIDKLLPVESEFKVLQGLEREFLTLQSNDKLLIQQIRELSALKNDLSVAVVKSIDTRLKDRIVNKATLKVKNAGTRKTVREALETKLTEMVTNKDSINNAVSAVDQIIKTNITDVAEQKAIMAAVNEAIKG